MNLLEDLQRLLTAESAVATIGHRVELIRHPGSVERGMESDGVPIRNRRVGVTHES